MADGLQRTCAATFILCFFPERVSEVLPSSLHHQRRRGLRLGPQIARLRSATSVRFGRWSWRLRLVAVSGGGGRWWWSWW